MVVLAVPAGFAAGAVLPGPHRMLCPGCYGLVRLGDNLYVDGAMTRAQRVRATRALAAGRARIKAFYGELMANPVVVVCRTRKCAAIFGSKGAKGITYGWQAILLSQSRILETIAAHEYAHAELHWRMGLMGWARGTVPAWFDEGLAVVLSQDPRFRRDEPPEAVAAVMKVQSYLGDWAQHSERVGWRTAYGAAATRVRRLHRRLGDKELLEFVERLAVEGGLNDKLRNAAGKKR